MKWIAPPERDLATQTLERRLWSAADQVRANSGLKAGEYSAPILGLIFLRFAEAPASPARRKELEAEPVSPRRGPRVDNPQAYAEAGVLYLRHGSRFGELLALPEGANVGEPPTPAAPSPERSGKRERITDKDPAVKLARHRLSVLRLAEELGSVSKACKQAGMDRTSFYEWKRRFQTHGLVGLKDLPPVHKSHPMTTPPEVQARIRELALQHPTRGCNFLSDQLALEGTTVSAQTVQSILNKQGLGGRYERLLALEEQVLEQQIEITPELAQQIEKANPAFAERHVESRRPGELLCQDTFFVGQFKGVGKVYLHTVVDSYGSYALGVLGTSKQPEWAVSVLYNDALPFYQEHQLPVAAVLTDNGREFCGTETHPYELFLSFRTSSIGAPKSALPAPTASWSGSTAPCWTSSSG